MDFKVNREAICTNEAVFDGMQEQSVELDYVLPDYYPDIFKLIKCKLFPRVASHNISGDKLTYELVVGIKIMYCCEGSSAIHCVDQKMNFSKTVDLSKTCESPKITIKPKTDYVNCRVVNQRRVDLRGAVSSKVKVTCDSKQYAVSDAFGMNVQVKKQTVNIVGAKINTSKRITVSEEVELGYSKPPILSIVKNDAISIISDKKIIANKLIAKGEAIVNLLYSCVKDGEDILEPMQFTVPFSQIMDMEGIDEQFDCIVESSVAGCDITPKSNAEGDSKAIECELLILISCTAIKSAAVDFVSDAYSTEYGCNCERNNAKIETTPKQISESFMTKATITCNDSDICCVYDVSAQATSTSSKLDIENGKIIIFGTISYSMMGMNAENIPIMLESDAPLEYT